MPGSPLITLSGGGFWQSGLDWICRLDTLPVSCRNVLEGAQFGLVFLQRGRRFWVFVLKGFDEQIERLRGFFLGLSTPHVVQHDLGFCLS